MKKIIKIAIISSLFFSIFACSTRVQRKLFVEVINGQVDLVIKKQSGDITLNQSDTILVEQGEKIKYEYSTPDDILIRFWDVQVEYIVEENYSDIHKHSGKFRL